jgi:hypothetical protein
VLSQVNGQLIDADPNQEYERPADHVTVMVRLQGFLRSDGRILKFYTHGDVFASERGCVIYKPALSLESAGSGTGCLASDQDGRWLVDRLWTAGSWGVRFRSGA